MSKSFGAKKALDNVDLQVPAGTVQGLLGPNGAGKTTLVRILATLLRPDAGSAFIGGVDVVKDPNTARSIFGLAGQYAAVDEKLTGRENLVMVGRLYRLTAAMARQRAAQALDRLGLVDAADDQVHTYSGGMRRRLDLGASLVVQPRVLILDEPTTGLDPRTRLDLWQFIRDLVAEGTTVLLTTQYLEEADQLADHIVVIDHGRVIARGEPEKLKSQLGGDLLQVTLHPADLDRARGVLAELGQSNNPDTKIPDTVTGDADTADLAEANTLLIPTQQSVPDLMRAAVLLGQAGIVPTDLGLRRPSLDDVFLALTGHTQSAENPGQTAGAR